MRDYLEEYDETDPLSIETYAKRLIGQTFADVCKQDDITKAKNKWKVIDIDGIKNRVEIDQLILELFK